MKKRKSCIMLAILMICGLILVNVALASDTVLQHFTSEDGSGQYPYGDLILGTDGYLG